MNGTVNWIAVIGAVWGVYGLAGVLGFQKAPPEFTGKSWLKKYKQSIGLSNLLLGALWLIAGLIIGKTDLSRPLRLVILAVLALPSLVMSVKTSQKYHDLAEEEKKAEQYFDPYGNPPEDEDEEFEDDEFVEDADEEYEEEYSDEDDE